MAPTNTVHAAFMHDLVYRDPSKYGLPEADKQGNIYFDGAPYKFPQWEHRLEMQIIGAGSYATQDRIAKVIMDVTDKLSGRARKIQEDMGDAIWGWKEEIVTYVMNANGTFNRFIRESPENQMWSIDQHQVAAAPTVTMETLEN